MTTLQGKRIFISGAAAGMGYSVARLAVEAGAQVHATDLSLDGLKNLAQDGVNTALLDVTNQADVVAYFADQPDFDGVVNMAGWVHHGTLTQTSVKNWHRCFAVNLDSMYYVLHAAIPGLIRQGGGSIVNMASLASSLKGFSSRAGYSASKAAVIGLTKSVAVDYMTDGIRCNAICPGTIETPSLHGRMAALAEKFGSAKKARDWFVSRQPMGRLGQPDEIANLVLYLLSDAGAYATGQPFVIDGGITA